MSQQRLLWGCRSVDLSRLQMQVEGDIDQDEFQERVRNYQYEMGVSVPLAVDLAADDMGARVEFVIRTSS